MFQISLGDNGLHVKPTAIDTAVDLLGLGRQRYETVFAERQVTVDLPRLGYRDIAAVIEGEVPYHAATEEFLWKLSAAKPHHSGWSSWISPRNAGDKTIAYVFDKRWEAFIALPADFFGASIDFWTIDPKGQFFLRRALLDDLAYLNRDRPAPKPGTQLDFTVQVRAVAETMAVALSFAKTMGCVPSETSVAFALGWTDLKGRLLTAWTDPNRSFASRGAAQQDEVITTSSVPLDTAPSSLALHVESALKELFALFGGTEFHSSVIEAIVNKTLSERL